MSPRTFELCCSATSSERSQRRRLRTSTCSEVQGCSGETAPEKSWTATTALAPGMAEAWFMGGASYNHEPAALTSLTCDGRVLLLVRCGSFPSCSAPCASLRSALPVPQRSLGLPVVFACGSRMRVAARVQQNARSMRAWPPRAGAIRMCPIHSSPTRHAGLDTAIRSQTFSRTESSCWPPLASGCCP